jgi:hypothetical protein
MLKEDLERILKLAKYLIKHKGKGVSNDVESAGSERRRPEGYAAEDFSLRECWSGEKHLGQQTSEASISGL